MNFIRPEVRALLWQWRDVLIGLAVFALGLWVFLRSFGVLAWLGAAAAIVGVLLVLTGAIRVRFRVPHGGPGVVEIIERRMTYFGPEGGRSFSFDEVKKIEIETTEGGPSFDDLFWIFHLEGNPPVRIPASAAEGEEIIDALSAFSGVNSKNVVDACLTTSRERFLVWEKGH